MATFEDSLAGNPAIKEAQVPVSALVAYTDDAILALYGYHRWPFLKEVNKVLTWTANAVTKQFDGIARITSIRYPDLATQLRPLKLMDDTEFAEFKYTNYSGKKVLAWRDAGESAGNMVIEMFAVPTDAVKLQCDVFHMPTSGNIDDLPGHFRRLVRLMVLSEIPNSGVSVANVDFAVREAISREEDMLGDVDYVGPDAHIQAMLQGVNNPT